MSAASRCGTEGGIDASLGRAPGSSRSTALGIDPARTTAPSASPSEQQYRSAMKRASARPVASNAGGPSTRCAIGRRPPTPGARSSGDTT